MHHLPRYHVLITEKFNRILDKFDELLMLFSGDVHAFVASLRVRIPHGGQV